jgi:hypothetical protein
VTDLVHELTRLQYDLTGFQARLTEVKRQVAALNPTPHEQRFVCPVSYCGLHKTTQQQLDEHLVDVHGRERIEVGG